MMKRFLSVLAVLIATGSVSLFATEADQFRLLSTLPQEHVQAFAAVGEFVYALSPGSLTVLDASTPGQEFAIVAAIPVDKDFVEIAADGRALALAARSGEVEFYERAGSDLLLRSRMTLADSVFGMQILGSQLCLAQGFAGTRIVDISDLSHPTTMTLLTEPDYSAEVEINAEFLYVLDRLNGVAVYSRADGDFEFDAQILTDLPPVDISAAKFGVLICFGTGRLEYWYCSTFNPPELATTEEFDFGITCVASNPAWAETLLVGGATGEIVEFRPYHIESSQRRNLGYPIKQLVIPIEPSLYFALDRIGNLTALASDDEIHVTKTYVAENSTGAMLATDNGLIVSTTRGIEIIDTHGSTAVATTLIPGFPLCQALAESEPYLFVAASGTVSVFRKERGELVFVASIERGLTVRNLFTAARSDGKTDLIVVGQEGVRSFVFDSDDNFAPGWSLDVAIPITCSDLANGLLAVAAEIGTVVVLNLTLSEPQFVARIPAREHPRDLAIVENNYVAIAHEEGVQIFRFEGGFDHTELASPIAVLKAHDLYYDPVAKELLVADGTSPVRYLDFSDPENLGIAYLIANSEGTARIAFADNRLYCQSDDWLRSFARSVSPTAAPAPTHLVHSITASPNPFNAATQITISLDPLTTLPQNVEIELVNILGQTIAGQTRLVIAHDISLNLADLIGSELRLPSGIYLCRIGASGNFATQKLLLLK